MNPDPRLLVEGLLGIVGTLSMFYLRQAVGEMRRMSAVVEAHGRSLSAGNERFRGLDRELERQRDDLKRLADAVARIEHDGCAHRKDCA